MASLIPPGFAVVGTGRCGTGYTSVVLRRCGVRCGHENWWTEVEQRRRSGLDGDSSWLALPDIESGAWSGTVLHITRHPVAVVRSFVALGFPDWLAARYEPDLAGLPQPDAAVQWWIRWNRRCAEVADLTVRVEELMAYLPQVARLLGYRLNLAAARQVRRDVNGRRRVELDEARVWELLDGAAAGYQL